MITRLALATGLTLAFALPVFAQETPPPPPPKHGEKEPGPHGSDGKGPPPPPPERGAGFELNYGRGVGIKVRCGDNDLSACLNSAKPLLDKLPAFEASMFPADKAPPPKDAPKP